MTQFDGGSETDPPADSWSPPPDWSPPRRFYRGWHVVPGDPPGTLRWWDREAFVASAFWVADHWEYESSAWTGRVRSPEVLPGDVREVPEARLHRGSELPLAPPPRTRHGLAFGLGCGALLLIALIGAGAFMLWFAAGFTGGDAGLDGLDSYSSPYGSPTADQRAAACEAAQNGQLSTGYGLLYGCDLSNADLSKNLAVAQLQGAKLNDANLSGANLTGANLNDAHLNDADLSGANLTGAYLGGADLSGANLSGASLNNAKGTSADLTDADLTDADLTDADLFHADLNGANLNGANLTRADIRWGERDGSNLTGANLDGVIWSDTTCPDGTNSGDHGNTCVGFGT